MQDNADIPESRFTDPAAYGQCGDKQIENQIKIRYNGRAKLFTANDQTIGQMILECEKEFTQTQKALKGKCIALGSDLKNPGKKVLLDNNMKASDLFVLGLNGIDLQSKLNQKGEPKYPQINEYKQPPKYFSEKIVISKIEKVIITVTLVYQSIDRPDQKVTVNVEAQSTVLDLKRKAKQAFKIPRIGDIILEDIYSILSDDNHLYDENIENQSVIYVRIIQSKACFPADTRIKIIKTIQNQKIICQKPISQIKKGDIVVSCNQKCVFQEDTVSFVQKVYSKTLMEVTTVNNEIIKSSTSDMYLTQDGWKVHSIVGNPSIDPEILKEKLTQNDSLMFVSSQCQDIDSCRLCYQKIAKISLHQYSEPMELFHLSIEQNHTYIVNGFIVHNMQIQVQDLQTQKIYKINANPSDLIQTVKERVASQTKLNKNEFTLLFVHNELDQNKSLNDYKIGKGDKLQMNRIKLKQTKSIVQNEHEQQWIVVKDKQKQYRLNYRAHSQKPVWKFLLSMKPKSPKHASLLHGKMFLRPLDLISSIQKNPDFNNSSEIHCILVQSAQRKLFYEQILTSGYENTIQSYDDPNKQAELINKFRSEEFNRIVNDQIWRFDPTDPQYEKASRMAEVQQTILGLMAAPKYENQFENYQVQTQRDKLEDRSIMEYNLYKQHQYLDFHKKNKTGQSLYFRQFLQTKKQNYRQCMQGKHQKKTVLFIRGLTGRDLGRINQNEDEQEVIFLPFTYFTIDHIIVNDKNNPSVQFVFMTEMQTLFHYSKPFFIWVDDQPNNPSNRSLQEEQIQATSTQFMRLVSTRQAENWMNEFAWLFNWQNIKFKIISDMTRYEISDKHDLHQIDEIKDKNYLCIEEKPSAAIDLIQKSCDLLGYTTLITIFCGDKANAEKRVKERNLHRGLNYHQIVTDIPVLRNNINDFLNPNSK